MAKKQDTATPTKTNTSAEARKEALLDAEARDSPVLTLIAKRLRAARKKLKKAEEIETIRASGRDINTDQEEVLKSKSKNAANIEELERLFPLLREAVSEEVGQKLALKAEEIEAAAVAAAAEKAAEEAKAVAEANEVEKSKAAALAEELKAKIEEETQKAAAEEVRRAQERAAEEARLAELQNVEHTSVEVAIMRVLQLIYFSKLFSKEGHSETDFVHRMEREACLTYNNFTSDNLTAQDLDDICAFGKLISSRSLTELISHETALERCKGLAMDWVNAEMTHIPELNTTVNELVVKFERITESGYYSIKPEIKGAHEVAQAPQPYRAEGSIPTPPGQDVNASAVYAPTSFPTASAPPPAPGPTSNNSALQQLLGRPNQGSSERQPSLEQGLQGGFIPSLSMGFTQPNSSGFTPSASTAFAPSSFSSHTQPPGFEPAAAQKAAASEANGPATPQYLNATFQGTNFGSVPKVDVGGPSTQSSSNAAPLFSQQDSPTPPADTSAAPPQQQAPKRVEGLMDPKASEQRGNSYVAPAGVRPRPPPDSRGRGRGPPRGRGGRQGGDSRGRRGGGTGGGTRDFRGRGREFPAHFNQQPLPQY